MFIFFNENIWISINVSLKFVPKGWLNNIPALVQIMAWHWLGVKPLSEPMIASLLMHRCVAWPHGVKLPSAAHQLDRNVIYNLPSECTAVDDSSVIGWNSMETDLDLLQKKYMNHYWVTFKSHTSFFTCIEKITHYHQIDKRMCDPND